MQAAGALQVNQGRMAGTGLRGPRGVVETLLPGLDADLRIGEVGADVDEPLGRGILGPQAVGTVVDLANISTRC